MSRLIIIKVLAVNEMLTVWGNNIIDWRFWYVYRLKRLLIIELVVDDFFDR